MIAYTKSLPFYVTIIELSKLPMDKKSTPSANQQLRSLMRTAMSGITPQKPRQKVLRAILDVAHTTPCTA